MRKKFIGYGIIGLIVLFGISVGFFYNLRKILKERKLLWKWCYLNTKRVFSIDHSRVKSLKMGCRITSSMVGLFLGFICIMARTSSMTRGSTYFFLAIWYQDFPLSILMWDASSVLNKFWSDWCMWQKLATWLSIFLSVEYVRICLLLRASSAIMRPNPQTSTD